MCQLPSSPRQLIATDDRKQPSGHNTGRPRDADDGVIKRSAWDGSAVLLRQLADNRLHGDVRLTHNKKFRKPVPISRLRIFVGFVRQLVTHKYMDSVATCELILVFSFLGKMELAQPRLLSLAHSQRAEVFVQEEFAF